MRRLFISIIVLTFASAGCAVQPKPTPAKSAAATQDMEYAIENCAATMRAMKGTHSGTLNDWRRACRNMSQGRSR